MVNPNTTQPTPAQNKRKELLDVLKSYDLGLSINRAQRSSASGKAEAKLSEYTQPDFIKHQITNGQFQGMTEDAYKARFEDNQFYTPQQRDAILRKFFPAKIGMDRAASLNNLKNNLEEILSDEEGQKAFAGLADNREALARLREIAQVKEDDAALEDIEEYGQYIALGKQLEMLKRYEANLGDSSKDTPEEKAKVSKWKAKKGTDIITEAPPAYREALGNMTVRLAVEEAQKKLASKYDAETVNALAETEQLIGSIDPSYDLVKKAVKKLSEEEGKRYTRRDNTSVKQRLYDHFKSNIKYGVTSQNRDLEDQALSLSYLGLNGSSLGKQKFS